MLCIMSFSSQSPPAGWYPDPAGSGGERYWDGAAWSQVTRPVGGPATEYAGQSPLQGSAQGYGTAPAAQTPWGHTGQGVPGSSTSVLAGFWWRVLAAILDALILVIPLSLIQAPITADANALLERWVTIYVDASIAGTMPPPMPEGILGPFVISALVTMLVFILYRTVLVTTKGGTLGQLITGLRVVPDGAPATTKPNWSTSGVRAVTAVVFGQIPILNLVDPLSMLASDKKQTLHDRIARTVVIKK